MEISISKGTPVLILILLEVTQIYPVSREIELIGGLNPYSTGSNSNLKSHIMNLSDCICLNPYSTGSNSNEGRKGKQNVFLEGVLILILLEVTQI